VQALLDAGDGHREAGRYDAARPLLTEAREVCERRLGPADPEYASAYNSLGILERYTGQPAAADLAYARAEAACRQHGDGGTDLASILHNRASLAHLEGRLGDARALITEAMALRAADVGARAEDQVVLAAILSAEGEFEQAEALMVDAERLLVDGSPRGEVHRVHLLADRALLAHGRGDLVDARRQYAAAREVTARVLGPRHPQVAVVLANSACCAADLGDDRAARAEAEAALELFAAHGADLLPSAALARQLLAESR
jgi:hypothetical protein